MSAQGSGITGWWKLAYLFGHSPVDRAARACNQSKQFVGASIAILGAAILVAGAGGLIRFDKCQVAPQLRPLSGNVEALMIVRNGHACAVHSAATQTIGKLVHLTTEPRYGVVTKRGTTGLIYRQNSKFRGDDFFAYVVYTGSSAKSAIAWIRVRVRVE